MATQTNNLRRVVILYWRHSKEDRENSWTKELYEQLIYDDSIHIRNHYGTEFIFANVNRRTESYIQNRDVVESLRSHKLRGQPLVFLDLTFPNQDGSREEFYEIRGQADINLVHQRIKYYLQEYER